VQDGDQALEALERTYSDHGLGAILISDIPNFPQLRKNLLT